LTRSFPGCTSNPCTSIPGFTASNVYWSSTSATVPGNVWLVSAETGAATVGFSELDFFARAVRGGP